MADAKELAKEELDCWHEMSAICPYCGHEDLDSWVYPEGETDARCPSCGNPYKVTVEIEVWYTTEPEGGWPDD